MFNLTQYLRTALVSIPGITDMERQFHEAAGYDQAETIARGIRSVASPLVIVENRPEGYLSFTAGFLNTQTISFYVLFQTSLKDQSSIGRAKADAWTLGLAILRRMVAESTDEDSPAWGFCWDRTSYVPIGPLGDQYYGFEFLPVFKTDVDMYGGGLDISVMLTPHFGDIDPPVLDLVQRTR